MSVQLILYSQANTLSEVLVNGNDFTAVNSAANYDTANTTNFHLDIQNNAPATIPNTWFRFRNTPNTTPSLAISISGVLNLDTSASTPFSGCGIYQQLSGLVAGQSYTVTVNLTSTVGAIIIARYSGQIGATFVATSANTSVITGSFTALSTNDTIFISLSSNLNSLALISQISITGQQLEEFEGQLICDLYEDEEIPLSLSVDNFKNVAEKIQSYSKDFNLPATKRNNKIFGNIFEITRTVANPYDFNPYVQTRAVLKQDGLILFEGSLKLIDIQDREGEISYNVNLYAQTIALADILKERTFDFINFDELQHTYDKEIIKGSWFANGLTLTNFLQAGSFAGAANTKVTDVLKYPFVDWTHQMLYANGSTGNNATLGAPELTSLEQAFRPWIKIKYLIDRIFSDAGYTYSSSIFSSIAFGKLFMDFNWGGDTMPSVIGDTSYTGTYDYVNSGIIFENNTATFEPLPLLSNSVTGGLSTSEVPPDYQTSGVDIYKIVSTGDNQQYNIDYNWRLQHQGATSTLNARWQFYDANTTLTQEINFATSSISGAFHTNYTGNIQVALNTGDKLWAEYNNTNTTSGSYRLALTSLSGNVTFNLSSSLVDSSTLNSLRGEINQWDFLKGIMTMFNLVTLQDKSDPANIIIETYSDVFIKTTAGITLKERNIQADWTNKIDLKDIKLTSLNDLKKKTTFKYEQDDDDYVFNLYKKSTSGFLYGSKVFSAEGLTLLEGVEEIVASPFAATVSKPLWDQLPEFITPSIYAVDEDGSSSGFENKPRILFQMNLAPITMSSTFFIPQQNGKASENSSQLFTFSHLTAYNPTIASTTDDYNFGECQLFNPIGNAVTSNLFNNYWLPYYNQLYNPDTKTMNIKVNLTAGDIAQFSFTDYIMIKNRAYRVNRIDYKPKDLSTVEFILIN
tara:strand:- start:2223 stop:4964 length:2742 start_codon:yes stop_codon:yes gene_type:complete